MQETLFTTNGFNKKKFDHDCYEKQNRQLTDLYAKSRSSALKATNLTLQSFGSINSPLIRMGNETGKKMRRLNTRGKPVISLMSPHLDLFDGLYGK